MRECHHAVHCVRYYFSTNLARNDQQGRAPKELMDDVKHKHYLLIFEDIFIDISGVWELLSLSHSKYMKVTAIHLQ